MRIRDYRYLAQCWWAWRWDMPRPMWRKSPLNREGFCAIVSKRGGFLYINIPKVANTSIRDAIAQFDYGEQFLHNERSISGEYLITHKDAEEFNGYRFSVVRHPLSRMISCYRNKVLDHGLGFHGSGFHELPPSRLPAGMSFREFLEIAAEVPDIEADQHIKSQSAYLEASSGTGGGMRVDFFARIESLDEDWPKIAAATGLPTLLPRRNATPTHIFKPDPDPALEAIVRTRYARDYELFGYTPLWQ